MEMGEGFNKDGNDNTMCWVFLVLCPFQLKFGLPIRCSGFLNWPFLYTILAIQKWIQRQLKQNWPSLAVASFCRSLRCLEEFIFHLAVYLQSTRPMRNLSKVSVSYDARNRQLCIFKPKQLDLDKLVYTFSTNLRHINDTQQYMTLTTDIWSWFDTYV